MKFPKIPLWALAFCGGAFFAQSLVAQPSRTTSPYSEDQASEGEDTFVLPTFTVASETVDRYRAADAVSGVRISTPLIETPSTISVLTRDFIQDVAPTRILDATRYTASVQAGSGTVFTDTMTVRGFPVAGRTIDNFIDGSGYLIEDATVERIEISKGPNAILAPGGSPGGHINVVTKSPEFKRSASLTGTYGEWDSNKFSLDFTDSLGGSERFAYRLIGVYQDTHRYYSKDQERSRKVLAPSFLWRISPTTELLFRYSYYSTVDLRDPRMILDSSVTRRGQKPILAPGFSPRSLNGTPPWSLLNFTGGRASAQLNTSFNKHVSMRLGVMAHRGGERSEQARPNFPGLRNRYDPYTGFMTTDYTWALADTTKPYDEATNPYVPTYSLYLDPTSISLRGEKAHNMSNKSHIIQNDWVLTYELPSVKFQTVTGWQYSISKSTEQRINGTMASYNIFDLENQDQSVVWASAPYLDNNNSTKETQLYLNQRIGLWDERISLTGGYLWYDLDHAYTSSISANNSLKDSKGIYTGGLLFRVTPQASVYYSYSGNASPTSFNNQRMWSEGKQHEVGVKTEFFNGRLAVNTAYFEIEQSNISLPNPDYNSGDLSAPVNILTASKNHGVELEVYGAITSNLSVMASYSNIKMRDPMGRPVRFVSENLASALLNYHFDGKLDGLSANIGVIYTGEIAGDSPPTSVTPLGKVVQHSFSVPAYTQMNAGVNYSWSRYQVRLYIDNLTDKRDFVQQGGVRWSVFTASGRLVRLSATLKF